jgi:hypothetical protein
VLPADAIHPECRCRDALPGGEKLFWMLRDQGWRITLQN